MSVCLVLDLPLPPSKNAAKVSKRRYIPRMGRTMNLKLNADATDDYRWKVAAFVRSELAKRSRSTIGAGAIYFDPRKDVVIECYWRKPSATCDCHNWHQELADMLQAALGVNDRCFLIRDMSQSVDPTNPGVRVMLLQK